MADRRKFMLAAHEKGMTNGEYVFIFADHVAKEEELENIWRDQSQTPDGKDQEAQKAFQMALMVKRTTNVGSQNT